MTITAATAGDKDEAIDSLVMAFGTDPILRWLYPSALLERSVPGPPVYPMLHAP